MHNLNTLRTLRVATSIFAVLSLVFSLTLASSTVCKNQAYAETSAEHEAAADEAATSAAKKQAEADELLAKIDTLQTSLNEANAEYERASAAYEEACAAADLAQKRIEEAQARISEVQEHLSARAVSLYKTGGTLSYLEVILNVTSFKDFATTLDSFERVINQDKELVQENKDAHAEAESAKAEYETQKETASQEMETANAAREEYESLKDTMQTELDQVNEEVVMYQAIEEEELIAAEDAKEREEEAARIAAEAKKNSSSSSSYSSGNTQDGKYGSGDVDSSGWTHPCPGAYATSEWGWRSWSNSFHTGIDLAASEGTEILAAAPGTVTYVGWYGSGGQAVIVSHGNGVRTIYMHMSAYASYVGEEVSAGTVIGYVGNTGNSYGAHLHFTVEINGTSVNPRNFLSF